MATTPHDSTVARALALRDWLDRFQLPPRVINPLRRDLEVALGQREDSTGKAGMLAGVDQQQFIAELYRDEGGLIRRVPAVGALVIEALREVIPPHQVAAPEQPPPPTVDESWRDFGVDDRDTSLVEPEVPPPGAPADDTPAPAVAAPKRRGRPRRVDRIPVEASAAAEAAAPSPAPVDAGSQPKRGRGRPRRVVAEVAAPAAPPAAISAPALVAPTPAPPAPALVAPTPAPPAPVSVDPDEAHIRRLWGQLHPQGRRAVLNYIAGQLVAAQNSR